MYTALIIAAFVIAILAFSNLVFLWTHNFVYSRKFAHGLIGLVILSFPTLFDTPFYPVVLSLSFFVVLVIAHSYDIFIGVAQKGRFSEIYFAFSVAVCLASGWWIDPWIGVAAALFLAWGDGITGAIRSFTVKEHSKDWRGSFGCIITCGLIGGLLVQPFWVGLIGALVGTLAEHFCGDAKRTILNIDDNLAMPLLSLAFMLGIIYAIS